MTDDTYTHDPSAFDEADEYDPEAAAADAAGADADAAAVDTADAASTDAAAAEEPGGRSADGRDFGWRGLVLVGWLVVAFVVVPAYLYFFPRAGDALSLFGLGYRDTYLFLPLIPAILLGLLAVWATTRP